MQAILLALTARMNATVAGHAAPVPVWMSLTGELSLLISSGLFMASLSPRTFGVAGRRVFFAVPYLVPQLVYATLYFAVSNHPTGALLTVYLFLAAWTVFVALIWSSRRGGIPVWLATALVSFGALICIPFFIFGNFYWPLLVLESGNMVMTALLVMSNYRRVSPGVFLAAAGFLAWGMPPFLVIRPDGMAGPGPMVIAHALILAKVVLAIGLVLLVLEDEIEKNETARNRERRIRLELEAYARQALTARNLEDFDRSSGSLCAMIVEHSRFASVAMIVRNASGSFTLVGFAGMDGATAGALDAVAQKLPSDCLSEGAPILVANTTAINLDLAPWLAPGDDLERLRLTRIGAVPLLSPDNSADGALLLSGPRVPADTLRADDLLPLEILAGRIQAARAQALMLGKLIDSERFAGVGQLANNVAQQLNNPLTVILGYSALLEESIPPGGDRRGAEAIAIEARRMKGMLERLSRFSKLSTDRFISFSVADLITDIEQLLRTDFLRHSIEFRLAIESNLPSIFGNAHQIRQALMHAMQFAIESVQRVGPNQEKSIRIEASAEEGRVRILIAHSGQQFAHPERVFDSFTTGYSGSEATGIGLSLCAAIVREHRGQISAINYDPTGAAVIFELPIS